MTRSALFLCAPAAVLWLTAVGGAAQRAATQQSGAAASRVDFARQVKPILEKRCLECHSEEKRKGGLSLATYADMLDGGRTGAAVRPGSSARSLIVQRVLGRIDPQMPKDEDPLSASEVALLRQWIDQGARETPASPPAPPPWEASLALTRPAVPAAIWPAWQSPIDRLIGVSLAARAATEPELVRDALFARRAYLDAWGLLPPPDALQGFLADQAPDKRERLLRTLLADNQKYAEHWISFWNDLLRNEDGTSYYSETAGRKSITTWLRASLESNVPYDRFVAKLLNPQSPGDPDGFVIGVNWRGETSAAVTPWMQASQNSAQIFLGVNLKCNACHDSFVSHWKLKDAYALASYFSPEAKLQLFRCDRPLVNQFAEPAFLYPELNRAPASASLEARRAVVAAIFTDARNGRLARTLVNRIWLRLFGYGLVANPDEMDGKPWDPAVLDWLAADFVDHGYDVKHLILTIMSSRAYQLPAVTRHGEPPARGYTFAGPEVRRLTAEQFADAIGAITGEWSVAEQRDGAVFAREWRAAASNLARALGRPIRDQVTSMRASNSTTLQGLELANGETLNRRLSRAARRLLGELPPAPGSLFTKSVAGRAATTASFALDVTRASRLWLIVADEGSSAPERNQASWADVELVGPAGTTPLSSLTPVESSGLRPGTGPIALAAAKQPTSGGGLRVQTPSRLVYDIAGQGYTRLQGIAGIENSDIGATLQPQIRFFIFDAEPDMDRLLPIAPGTPLPVPAAPATAADVVDRIFWYALSRAPLAQERLVAEEALRDLARPGRASAPGVADLLWAVLMKPEFQLIY